MNLLNRQDKPMSFLNSQIAKVVTTASLALTLSTATARAAPTAEIAKRCVHYSYIAYPWKRPGSGPMSGDRQAYINDCFARNGNVPMPTPPAKSN
jgi:hypothetical protein